MSVKESKSLTCLSVYVLLTVYHAPVKKTQNHRKNAYFCVYISDFADLFPDRNTMEGPFTVITLSQHTDHDMSMWSMEVEEERESLLDTVSFVH